MSIWSCCDGGGVLTVADFGGGRLVVCLVTGFTSRSIDLSWAKPRKQSKEAPITGYSIVTG